MLVHCSVRIDTNLEQCQQQHVWIILASIRLSVFRVLWCSGPLACMPIQLPSSWGWVGSVRFQFWCTSESSCHSAAAIEAEQEARAWFGRSERHGYRQGGPSPGWYFTSSNRWKHSTHLLFLSCFTLFLTKTMGSYLKHFKLLLPPVAALDMLGYPVLPLWWEVYCYSYVNLNMQIFIKTFFHFVQYGFPSIEWWQFVLLQVNL